MTPPVLISPGTLHVIYSWRGYDFYAITPHPHSPSSDSPSRTAAQDGDAASPAAPVLGTPDSVLAPGGEAIASTA